MKTDYNTFHNGDVTPCIFKFIKIGILVLGAILTMFALNSCGLSFTSKTEGMKRPIIVVAKRCQYGDSIPARTIADYCGVILRDSTGRMATLNSDSYANTIAASYNVGDTLK